MLFRYWVYVSFMFLALFFPPFYFCSLHYHHHRTPSAHHQSLDSLHHPLIISLTPITVNHHPLLSAIKLSLLLSFSVNGIRTSFRTSLLGILRLCKTGFRDARIIASGVTLWIVYATKYVVVVWGSEECSAYVLWRGDVLSDLSHTLHLLTLHFHTLHFHTHLIFTLYFHTHFIFTHNLHTIFSHTLHFPTLHYSVSIRRLSPFGLIRRKPLSANLSTTWPYERLGIPGGTRRMPRGVTCALDRIDLDFFFIYV